MSPSQEKRQPHGRMLAFLMMLALLVVMGIPQGEDAFADGTAGNDTLTRSFIEDSTEVVTAEKKLTFAAESNFGEWLFKMAMMLL